MAELYLNENWAPVDLIFSYSSLEHDGLDSTPRKACFLIVLLVSSLLTCCAVLCYDAAVCVGMETRSTPSETWSLWEERGAS